MPELDENLSELIEYRTIDPKQSIFETEGDGFLSLTIGDTCYKQVSLIRLLPFDQPNAYISCVSQEKEIGVIEDIAQFSEQQQKILQDQLYFRYYLPEVEKIISMKEKMWFLFIRAIVNGQERELCLHDLYNSIKYYNHTDVLLTDVEENRYLLRDVRNLPKKQYQRLEVYL